MTSSIQKRYAPSRRRMFGAGLFVGLLCLGASAMAQTKETPAPVASPTADDVVKLSPFTVSTDRDYGYKASNSIAGTRTNTPIKDIPINIQVFTKELADDLQARTQLDLEAYNASLVYGGADVFSSNAIQQPYQNFLFRGFRQNWGLRDGIREYDPIDLQNIERVEVVKGPAAALYGLAYPGGVMQNITKTVNMDRNFAVFTASAGGEGDYRGTVDANVQGKLGGGKIGLRYNGAYEVSKDAREHSEGSVKLSAIALNWEPMPSTAIDFLYEEGYREKPNALGYFTTAEIGAIGNQAAIPLQILHPDVPWEWNWESGGNMRSLETELVRGRITQKIGENFQVQAYYQYSSRLNIDGNGWDANGSGGANSWESAGSGWDAATNKITQTYNYRDWGNQMHAYGATGVYKADFGGTKNTFAFGANVWQEDELSQHYAPLNPMASAIVRDGKANVSVAVPLYPPADLTLDLTGGNGNHHENNSNDYYFVNWQMYAFGDKLKTNIGVNRTNMKLLGWNNAQSTSPDTRYEASKTSPLYGVVYDITKELSVFGVYATSLFPDTTKDSFGRTFAPQVGESVEFGLKFDLFDGKLSGTVSYYDITQTGGTQNDPNAVNATTLIYDSLTPAQKLAQYGGIRPLGDIIAGGEQESKGFEADIIYQPTRQWQIMLSYANVDHQFTESAVPATIGQTYPQAIKERYSLLTRYQFTEGAVKGLQVGGGISGGSKSLQDYQRFNNVDVARYWPGRTVLELFAAYRFTVFGQKSWVQLNIKNLTEEPTYTGWKATGSATKLSTDPYEVPTPIVYSMTFGIQF